MAEYEAEIAQTPKAFEAAFNLGKLLMRARPEEARTGSRETVDWNPESETAPLGHHILADIYNRRGRPEEAARQVATARRLEKSG